MDFYCEGASKVQSQNFKRRYDWLKILCCLSEFKLQILDWFNITS